MSYQNEYNQRINVPTDVVINLSAIQVSGQTYRVTAQVCIESGGVAKTMRIYIVQVLDYWPASPNYHRNGFKQAATTQDITLNPGQCQQIQRDFTFDTESWNNRQNIRIIAWAQRPLSAAPAEVYNAAFIAWPFMADCNGNSIPDECDLSCDNPGCSSYPGCGQSQNCNGNNIPDECETDCNGNGVPDDCDILYGTSPDCDGNGVPDECQPGGTSDCNSNGVADLCDIFNGTSADCNRNAVPDECDILGGTSGDCNNNWIPDECELAPPAYVEAADNCVDARIVCPGTVYMGTTVGATVDGSATCGYSSTTPDVWYLYEPVGNGLLTVSLCGSAYDTVLSVHTGCPGTTSNQIACNDNYCGNQSQINNLVVQNRRKYWIRVSGRSGAVGSFVLTVSGPRCAYSAVDCNYNGVLDECDIANCPPNDPSCQDCNHNDVPDGCDIANGTSQDANGNGVPDECEGCAGQLMADANCDGAVNAFDIDAFVLALTNPTAWEAQYGANCDIECVCDCNEDGEINAFDIDPFVDILTGLK